MLLCRLAASTPIGVAGSVTLSSSSTVSAAASQSSTEGPPSTPTPGPMHGSPGWYWPSPS